MGGCNEHKCPEGHSCGYTNYSLWCTPCPPGTYGSDGLTCAPCKPGYGPDAANTGCKQCRRGQYSTFGECMTCEFPRRITKDNDLSIGCGQCDFGHQPDDNQTTCVDCPAGKVTQKAGAECTKCSTGMFANSETRRCDTCEPGKQPDADAASCIKCQGGNFSERGSQCVPCTPPLVVKDQGAKCGKCNAGQGPACAGATWADGTTCSTPLTCAPCQGNTHSSPEHTGGRCDPCPEGTYTNPAANGEPARTRCPECESTLLHSAWSNRTGKCECATKGGVNNAGYYDVSNAMIICFHDGFHQDVVDEVIDSFTELIGGGGQFEQCQRCPDCIDCSVEGAPRLKSGYTFGEPHVLFRGQKMGKPRKQQFTHSSGERASGYMHFVFFCDADTAVTPADIVERGYFTTQKAIGRCNNTDLILPVVTEEVDAVVLMDSEAGATCAQGYTGAFCESCIHAFHKQKSAGACVSCWQGAQKYQWWMICVGIILFIIVVVVLLICCNTTCKTALRDPNTLGGATIGGSAARQRASQGVMQRQDSSLRTCCYGCVTEGRWRKIRLLIRSLFPSVKTLITYYMVTGQLGHVLHVQYPIIFSTATSYFHSFVVIDVWSLLSVECDLHWNTFKAAWILRIVAKPGLLLLLPVFKFVYDWRSERLLVKRAEQLQMEQPSNFTAHDESMERRKEELDEAQEQAELARGQACQSLVQNLLRVTFLCYPSVCNMAFSTLHCRPAEDGVRVLVYDDRVDCPQSWWASHPADRGATYSPNDSLNLGFIWASMFVILFIGFGIPLALYINVSTLASGKCCPGCCCSAKPVELNKPVFEQASAELEDVHTLLVDRKLAVAGSLKDQVIAAYIETTRLQNYTAFTEAYSAYRPGTRRCMCLPWSNSTWESVDMLRKILLVGVVVLVGRGSVAQLLCSIALSFAFFSLHVKMWPMKTDADNHLRAACEVHVFITILVGFAMKSDLSQETLQHTFYDWLLFSTMVLCVWFGTIWTVYSKWRRIVECIKLERNLPEQRLRDSPLSDLDQLGPSALKRRARKAGMDGDRIAREPRQDLIQFIQAKNHQALRCSFLRYCAAVSTTSDHDRLRKYFEANEKIEGGAAKAVELQQSLLSNAGTDSAEWPGGEE